jgi:hypothetical protein
MREISNTNGSISDGKTSGENRDFTAPFAGEGYQNIVEQANSVSIKKIFNVYGVRLDELNRKTTCPFKSHKGGRESTASFYYYPDTNTYFCYGCRQGSKPTDFVMHMDRSNKITAAKKILENFYSNDDGVYNLDNQNFSERLEILMEFSNAVRNFHINFTDEESFYFIEEKCRVFDTINLKHDLNNDALKSVVIQLVEIINNYKI